MVDEVRMNGNMDNLFVRDGRPLRIHFDNTRITALAIRQLSWVIEKAGGATVDGPSSADVLVVDPAAAWVFQAFLKTKRPELRPIVVLAFWIPLCLTSRNLIWMGHTYWEQVAIPSEWSPRSGIPQGITAYSSFLAGITYAKHALPTANRVASRSSNIQQRDSSVVSHLDNSDAEVSQSLELGLLSDDESLETTQKSSRDAVRGKKNHLGSPRTNASPERPTERDEAEVSGIIPTDNNSLPLEDVNMTPVSPITEPAQQPLIDSALGNVAPPSLSAPPTESAKRQSLVPESSNSERPSSPRPSSSQNDTPQPSVDTSVTRTTVAVDPDISSESSSIQPAETEPPIPPPHSETKSTVPRDPETVVNGKEAYVPPTLESTTPPVSEHPTTAPLESNPHVPNITTDKRSIDGTTPNISSGEDNISTSAAQPLNVPDESPKKRAQSSIEASIFNKPSESTMHVAYPAKLSSTKPRASTSSAHPTTPHLL
ncbi:hypothetical protein RSOLAG1IB_05392 [Rhizoctonia solani AG-1 IB]|uniref:BRCT domain-containing protein n=1 Tax=Thanatephorus cucumeris (strain AG1-IB / isolate 7/3/14) TaxID=1108050 RepID=A0A0B7G4B9_THACB|nr:hypothetical protein RSOLAG1IB_05392 [Rhizoctonia solani AG-1 IB]